MKKTSFQINIENPCHEDWDKMTNVEQGRYCSQCCKSVIDFSHMSDQEIVKLLKKMQENCVEDLHQTRLIAHLLLLVNRESIILSS